MREVTAEVQKVEGNTSGEMLEAIKGLSEVVGELLDEMDTPAYAQFAVKYEGTKVGVVLTYRKTEEGGYDCSADVTPDGWES